MENLSEDGFERCEQFGDWSTFSSEHWDVDHRDSGGFGDWTSFEEGLREEIASADLPSQEGETSANEHEVERGDDPWIVIRDCFHVEKIVRDKEMMDVLPLSQILQNSCTYTPYPPAAILRKGASFHHELLRESKPPSIMGPKPNSHSHKQLTDTLQLKQSNTLQNTDLPHFGSDKPEPFSASLIQTKLTSAMCSNSPGFFYQISRQWLSQHSSRHQDKKDLL